jgi:hypothetical protein
MLAIQANREPANAGGADHDAGLSISSSLYKGEVLGRRAVFRCGCEEASEGIETIPDTSVRDSKLVEPDLATSMRPPVDLNQLQPSRVATSQETLTEIVETLAAAQNARLPDAVSPLLEDQHYFKPFLGRGPLEDLKTISSRLYEELRRLIDHLRRRG